MGQVFAEISMSLDGYVAGPTPSLDDPLGEGGERLHDWVLPTKAWRERHGKAGGETGPDNEILEEGIARSGATVMGRKMYSGGAGPWESDPKADGWWGDQPPFQHPVFVLTHHAREPVSRDGGTTFTFVTDGIESAVEQAREAAGDKDVSIAGGADVIRQALKAGLVDEVQLHVAPILLGGGVRLLDNLGPGDIDLEQVSAVGSPSVAHLTYKVA
jgi:dihydrofolate reductase